MRGVRAGPRPQLPAVAWALATGPCPLTLERGIRDGLPCCSGISDDKGLVVDLTGRADGTLSKAFVMALAGQDSCRLRPGGQFWTVVGTILAYACPRLERALPWLCGVVAEAAAGAERRGSRRIDGVTYWVWFVALGDGMCVMVQAVMP